MPRRRHPAHAVMTFFQTQPKEVCDLTLSLVKAIVESRFGRPKPAPAAKRPRKTKDPVQLDLGLEGQTVLK